MNFSGYKSDRKEIIRTIFLLKKSSNYHNLYRAAEKDIVLSAKN